MTFSAFFTYVFISTFTPGPNNIMAMTNAGKAGFKKSIPFCLGVGIGFFIINMLSIFFSVFLYNIIPSIKPVMLIAGALYMLYLAWKTYKSSGDFAEQEGKPIPLVTAIFLQFINPKGVLFSITAASGYIVVNHESMLSFVLLSVFMAGLSFLSTLSWTWFGALFKKTFSKHAKVINSIMALLLVYCATSLFM